jgi:hypothetical protein
MPALLRACILVAVLSAAGCASTYTYTTPGAGLNLKTFANTEPGIEAKMKVEPAVVFPARLAVARVQAPGYASRSAACFGTGRYCVVTARDIETDESQKRLAGLPLVAGVAVLNRMLLPERIESTQNLREAAAALKTDMLLLYSIDTVFNVESTDVGPLAIITLGFLPTKNARVTATASAALYDVRTGFVYGLAEASATDEQRGTFWSTADAIDTARRRAEADAFQKMIGEVEKFWGDVLKTHVRIGASS